MAVVSEALSLRSRLVFEFTLELARQVFPEGDAGTGAGMEAQDGFAQSPICVLKAGRQMSCMQATRLPITMVLKVEVANSPQPSQVAVEYMSNERGCKPPRYPCDLFCGSYLAVLLPHFVEIVCEWDQAIACFRSEMGDGACRGLWIRHGELAEVSG
jgi:hypothetical protein